MAGTITINENGGIFYRTCQECSHEQNSKAPWEYPDDRWADIKCRKCHSMSLDYGKFPSLENDDGEIIRNDND